MPAESARLEIKRKIFGSNPKLLFLRLCNGRGGMIGRLFFSATSGVDAAVRLAQLAELVEAVTATEVAMSNGIGLNI